jgi:lipopolysaccharide export system protein LptC
LPRRSGGRFGTARARDWTGLIGDSMNASPHLTGGRPPHRESPAQTMSLPLSRSRQLPTARGIARRQWFLLAMKLLLPVAALLLLASIAIWPELHRSMEAGRITFRRVGSVEAGAGQLIDPRYQGFDTHNRPFTLTADTATQINQDQVKLDAPKGDMVLPNGTWLMVQSHDGVFGQHTNLLDLSGEVTLYRQDGTMMTSATASLDLKQGAATSNDYTHAEGPFGTLDAEGFTLVDKGDVVQFRGPARLVMNGAGQ